jgi:hypothetical protein
MVLGIGEGKLEIKIPKTVVAPGETVSGEVVLTLNSPKKAKEMRILFYGEVTEHYSQSGKRHSRTKRIYEQRVVLGNEGEFPAGTKSYPFQITMPNIERTKGSGEGLLGSAMNAVAGMFDPLSGARWYLDASLDMPLSFDISKRVQLTINR